MVSFIELGPGYDYEVKMLMTAKKNWTIITIPSENFCFSGKRCGR